MFRFHLARLRSWQHHLIWVYKQQLQAVGREAPEPNEYVRRTRLYGPQNKARVTRPDEQVGRPNNVVTTLRI